MIAIYFCKPLPSWPMRVLRQLFIGTCLILVGVTNLASLAKADSQIKAANSVINTMTHELEAHLASSPNNIEQRKHVITRILDNYFDLPNIARFSVGPYWRAATEDERRIYIETFRLVMIGSVLRNFDQLTGLKFERTDSEAKGDKMVIVHGNFVDIRGIRPPIAVGWRIVTPDNGTARVLDVDIENISMLVTQKQENMSIIRKNEGRFGALIEAMRLKTGN